MRGTAMARAAIAAAAAAAALAVPATGWAANAWNVVTDFSLTSNPSGAWSYGWSASRGAPFTLFTAHNNGTHPGVAGDWAGPFGGCCGFYPLIGINVTTPGHWGSPFIPPGTVYAHPGPSGQNAVIRWTAPTGGSYAVSATWTGRDQWGTTTDDAVLMNGSDQLFAGEVNGYLAAQSYSGTLRMQAGDTLDFTVGYGNNGSYWDDSTGVAIEIDQADTTPPVVSVPDSMAVDANSPDGAEVSFKATATDPDDQAGPVTCDPASGSTFPIGDTTVTCSSTDTNGNTGSASFTVHVRGAGEQLDALAAYVAKLPPGKSLAAKVRATQAYLAANDIEDACSTLDALAHEADAQHGKKLTSDQADTIATTAGRIRAVLGCG